MLTVDDIIQQCVISPYGLYPLDKKLYKKVWQSVGEFVEQRLLHGEAVNFIHFGQFTFKFERAYGARRTVKIPTYIVSSRFAKEHTVRYQRIKPSDKIVKKEVDINAVAELAGESPDKVYQVIQDVLRCVGDNVHEQRSVMIDFKVGKLCCWTGYCTMRYADEFLKKVEALQAANRLGPNAPVAPAPIKEKENVVEAQPEPAVPKAKANLADEPETQSVDSWVLVKSKEEEKKTKKSKPAKWAQKRPPRKPKTKTTTKSKSQKLPVEEIESMPEMPEMAGPIKIEEMYKIRPMAQVLQAFGNRDMELDNDLDSTPPSLVSDVTDEPEADEKKSDVGSCDHHSHDQISVLSSEGFASIQSDEYCNICKSRSNQIGYRNHKAEEKKEESLRLHNIFVTESLRAKEEEERLATERSERDHATYLYNVRLAEQRREEKNKRKHEAYNDLILSKRPKTPPHKEQKEAYASFLDMQIRNREARKQARQDELRSFEQALAEKSKREAEEQCRADEEKKRRDMIMLNKTWDSQVQRLKERRQKGELPPKIGKRPRKVPARYQASLPIGQHEKGRDEFEHCKRCGNILPWGLDSIDANLRLTSSKQKHCTC